MKHTSSPFDSVLITVPELLYSFAEASNVNATLLGVLNAHVIIYGNLCKSSI